MLPNQPKTQWFETKSVSSLVVLGVDGLSQAALTRAVLPWRQLVGGGGQERWRLPCGDISLSMLLSGG